MPGPDPEKAVYVLGAGVATTAGMPMQRDLLGRVLDVDVDATLPEARAAEFRRARGVVERFVRHVFQASPESLPRVPLENILTLIDRGLEAKENLQGYDPADLTEVRRALVACITLLLDEGHRRARDAGALRGLARGLVVRRLLAGQWGDPFALVTLNWDIVLDEALQDVAEALNREAAARTGRDVKGARLDHAAYTTAFDDTRREDHVPSLYVKALGYHNVKLLKLHGSLNWVTCPSCEQLYVRFRDDIAVAGILEDVACDFCADRGVTAHVQSLIVTPTYLKEFRNTHVRMIWHSALIEIGEATRVVFIGYSFPEADFDFRYLLAKAVRRDATIEVVTAPAPASGPTDEQRALVDRYATFFGPHRVKARFTGVEGFVDEEFPEAWRRDERELMDDVLGPWLDELAAATPRAT